MDSGLVSGNRWLRFGGVLAASNTVPAIVPFNFQPISIEFSNANAPTSFLIDFYRDRSGDLQNLYTWTVSGKKRAYKTSGLSASFIPNDALAIRVRQSGAVLASDPLVRICFVILDETTGEGGT
jgi:hypothetical protein